MAITKHMNMLEKAFDIAYGAHFGQRSFRGRPYILHPIRVMEQMDTDEERAVALMHDVLEDSLTPVEMLEKHFPSEVVAAVVALTHEPFPQYDQQGVYSEEEWREVIATKYQEYIEEVAKNPLARKVKLADLKDNMNVARLPKVTDGALRRLRRYYRAFSYLLNRPEQ